MGTYENPYRLHRAQGMTLEAVNVSTQRMFECGQFYVALSRARSLAGVTLVPRPPPSPHEGRGGRPSTDWCPGRIRAHPAALRFYRNLCVSPSTTMPAHPATPATDEDEALVSAWRG